MTLRAVLALALAAAGAALAQPVYLRTPGTNYCDVIDATNATPIHITVSNSCGLTNGATVVVVDVRGNTAANIHLESAADTSNMARIVSGLSGNGFDLLDLAGNPVVGTVDPSCADAATTHAGTCTYTGGGRVGLAAQRTLRSGPLLFFDGTGGARTLAYQATPKAATSNPSYNLLLDQAATYAANYAGRWGYELLTPGGGEAQGIGLGTINSALRWLLTGNTASRDAALFSVGDNPDQTLGSPACVETDGNCESPASSIMDYPMQFSQTYYQAYSIMRPEMSAPQKQKFTGFFLSDHPWHQAGIGYTGATLTRPQFTKKWSDAGGTAAVTQGSTTVTGTGTSFTTQCAAGGILTPGTIYSHAYLIVSVDSDTSLTLAAPAAATNTDVTFSCAPRWDPSMYGFLWHQKHMQYHTLNGSAAGELISPYYAGPGGLAGLFHDGYNNHSLVRTMGMFALGTVTCPDDPRGCLLAAQADEWLNDVAMPYVMTIWTGFSWAGNTYHQGRILNPILNWSMWRQNSFAAAGDPLAGTDVREKAAKWTAWTHIPRWNHLPNAENAWISPGVLNMSGSLASMTYDPSAVYSRNLHWWMMTGDWFNPSGAPNAVRGNYGAAALSEAAGAAAWVHYMSYEPATTQTPIVETTAHFTTNNQTVCVATYGTEHCTAPDVRRISISRTDWTSQATWVAVNSTGYGCRDHCADDLGGYFYIFKNMQPLLGVDDTQMIGSVLQRGYPLVGPASNLLPGGYYATPTVWTAGNNDFMFVRTDIKPIYKPAAQVTAMERQIFHLKGAASDYVIDHVSGTMSSPQTVRGVQHYNLNGCGTPASTSCVTLTPGSLEASHVHTGTGVEARLNSKLFSLGGAMTLGTESGTATNGTYAGGNGASFRWHVEPAGGSSVTTIDYAVVHQPSVDTNAVLPSITQTNNGVFHQFEIHDPVSPRFLAFTARGATPAGHSFVSTHAGTGQYVIAGLQAGLYEIRRNGVLEGNPIPVAASANTLSFSGLAGSYAITPRVALTITTTALPNAVIGRPYQTVVEASGAAAPPYDWDLASGTLCGGLTLTPGSASATIAGTATSLQTCTFTVRVTSAGTAETDSRQFTITVQEPSLDPLILLTAAVPAARLGEPYDFQLRSTGGTTPVAWSVSAGELCPGLSLSATGRLAGTALIATDCAFTLRVTDLGNVFVERQFATISFSGMQQVLAITGIQASHSGAVLHLGGHGLAFDQACSVTLRENGPGGAVLQTLESPAGPARRQFVATGLPSDQTIHAEAVCGSGSTSVEFATAVATGQPVTVDFHFPASGLPSAPADIVLDYGDSPAVSNSATVACSPTECAASVDTSAPLLYWRVRYRDSLGATLAQSALRVLAPR